MTRNTDDPGDITPATAAQSLTPAAPADALHRAIYLLPSANGTPTLARRHVDAKLRDWKVPLPGREDVAVVVSELVTNAVRHTLGCSIRIELAAGATEIGVTVIDGGSHRRPVIKHPDEETESGRGLLLVKALSARWGHRRHGHGTAVWAVLSTAAEPAPVHRGGTAVYADLRIPAGPEASC